jgi:hypothetical protein
MIQVMRFRNNTVRMSSPPVFTYRRVQMRSQQDYPEVSRDQMPDLDTSVTDSRGLKHGSSTSTDSRGLKASSVAPSEASTQTGSERRVLF